jgi:hypothetical protein
LVRSPGTLVAASLSLVLALALALAADRLAQGNATLLTLGYKIALLLGIAQHPLPLDLLAKALEQLLL